MQSAAEVQSTLREASVSFVSRRERCVRDKKWLPEKGMIYEIYGSKEKCRRRKGTEKLPGLARDRDNAMFHRDAVITTYVAYYRHHYINDDIYVRGALCGHPHNDGADEYYK